MLTGGGNLLRHLNAANLAYVFGKTGLSTGGRGHDLSLAPAVALGLDHGDLAIIQDLAADGALVVGIPAVLLAGGLLVLMLDPGMAAAAGGKLIPGVKIGNGGDKDRLKVSLLAVGATPGELTLNALERLGPGGLSRRAAALFRKRIEVDAGLPVHRRGDAVARLLGIDKEIRIYNLPENMLRLLVVVAHPGEAGDDGHLFRERKLLRVRICQRQQRQNHQRRKRHCEDSYSTLFHGTKPLVLEKFCQQS